ncbi:tyrosine-type recombinase/integrase [Paenibacillus naphthalenovorans]|uniref:tyrosine-type recombinase/integrase n=1 Tax=Paenibacillus naphthalenovorans TaxID=162209 RepID=UPI000887B18C|nr:tyrosine-type recombinase/integrase [Paenibacillus naphthalenovorans]SDJ92314.1 integrase/recombinase XerD [Paenibacillus naphthalenovorans]
MPKIIQDTHLQELNNRMKELLSSYGADKLTLSIQSLPLQFHPSQKTPKNEPDVLLTDAVESFFLSSNILELSKTSQTTYRSEMKLFLQYVQQHFGKNALFQSTTNGEFLSDYINQYSDQNTKAKKSSFLRTFIKTTYKKFYGHQDLEHLKKVLRVRWLNDDTPKAFTKAQIAEILMIAQSRNHDTLYTAIIWTFLGSGIRINELCHLQIGDIDPHTQTLKVIPKGAENTKKSRKINQLALLMLTDYIEKKYSRARETLPESEYKQLYVFSSTGGKKPLTPRAIQHFMKSIILETQSIPVEDKDRLGPHSFRHTFAIQGLEAGIDIYTLAKLLGHESLDSTMKYLRMFDDQLKHAINKHPFAREVMRQIKERLESK